VEDDGDKRPEYVRRCLLRRDVPADINATRRNLMSCNCLPSLGPSGHMTFYPHVALEKWLILIRTAAEGIGEV
jgi:hypothetical protein